MIYTLKHFDTIHCMTIPKKQAQKETNHINNTNGGNQWTIIIEKSTYNSN